jgi:putative hydrolase
VTELAEPVMARPDLGQDLHVHSVFSDGRNTIEENVAQARLRGLHTLCLVDHVRADTDWLPEFIEATGRLREADAAGPGEPLEIRRGVETKVLDHAGHLDLPPGLEPLDHILVADHQFPLEDGPHHPKEIEAQRAEGQWDDTVLATLLIEAVGNSLGVVEGRGILAHMFSILPKAGMSEEMLPPAALDWLAQQCAHFGVAVEVNERWGCPGPETLRHFVDAGVLIVCATDSHRIETIGLYDRVRSTIAELADEPFDVPDPSEPG